MIGLATSRWWLEVLFRIVPLWHQSSSTPIEVVLAFTLSSWQLC